MASKLTRPEILAPAGDRESLEAALRGGADAVYFGLQGFNARARATNFDVADLKETMRYLHERGARGYVTLNTLVFDGELGSVEAAVRACAEAGVDAVIVQDVGVAKIVRAIAPTLPIHASTQMTCTDTSSVEFARDLGASRVILAREMSLEDIAKVRAETDVEVEVFVHGALCISYSGQCLTSEAIGGRSANRGACAQACRLPYELIVDGEKVDTKDDAYLLSPEDLESESLVPEFTKLGISSLKIEGRLKGPEYTFTTSRLYRKAAEAAVGEGSRPTASEKRDAVQAFTRGSGTGFFGGVDHQRLVEGRTCDHRGLTIGTFQRVERRAGKAMMVVQLSSELSRGDGVLIEGGFASEGEIGGRVWAIVVGGKDVPTASASAANPLTCHVWLGPHVDVFDASSAEKASSTRRIFKTNDPTLEKRVASESASEGRRVRLDVRVSGKLGESFVLEGRTSSGAVARVVGDAPIEEARSVPVDEAVLRDKLGRLGDTVFELGALTVDLPPSCMLPLSSLNRARRALTSALLERAPRAHATTNVSYTKMLESASTRGVSRPAPPHPHPALFVLCRTMEQADAAVRAGASGVYLDFLELTGTGNAVRELRARHPSVFVGVAPTRIRKPGEEKIDRYLASLSPDAVLVRGLGALRELSLANVEEGADRPLFIGDFSLNVTNRLSAYDVLGRGLDVFTPSFDLDAAQLVALMGTDTGALGARGLGPWAEVVVHHPMALFHMEHCVIAARLSDGKDYKTCGRPCEHHRISLRDRAGMDHPVEADVGCRNTVFHAKPQSAVQLVPQLATAGVRRFRIELVRESEDDVTKLVRAYLRVLEAPAKAHEVWRELRTEGGYGVVKGSLRVIA